MNKIGIALRAYAAGMIHAKADCDHFNYLAEDIVRDGFMACRLANVTADQTDEQWWTDTSHAWRLWGHLVMGDSEYDPGASKAAIAAAEFLNQFLRGHFGEW